MAENRRGTERRVPAARRLSKAADVPKDEVGQGAGPVAAADVEATSLAMRPRARLTCHSWSAWPPSANQRCCECLHGAWFGTHPWRMSLLSTWRNDSGRFESVAGRKENSAESGRRFFLFRGARAHTHTHAGGTVPAGPVSCLSSNGSDVAALLLLPSEPSVPRFCEVRPATARPKLGRLGCA